MYFDGICELSMTFKAALQELFKEYIGGGYFDWEELSIEDHDLLYLGFGTLADLLEKSACTFQDIKVCEVSSTSIHRQCNQLTAVLPGDKEP